VLSQSAPPAGSVKLKPLAVKDGNGCGLLAARGSVEGAYALLRREADKLGANYVQILSVEEPILTHECMGHEYKATGIAYRKPSSAPLASPPTVAAPLAPPSPTAPPSPAALPRVCIPGATQACLGPGACQGAQACRNDATGFEPCDCGTP
jgi:hypothetical protein